MSDRDAEASEIASVIEDVIANMVAATDQSINTNEMANRNVGGNNNKMTFDCLVPDCEFATPGCDLENVASDLLAQHINFAHKEPLRSERTKHTNKIFIPETLDMDPSEDCDEEFSFWCTRF